MQMRTRAWRMGFQAGVAASVDDNNKARRERASQECTRRSHSASLTPPALESSTRAIGGSGGLGASQRSLRNIRKYGHGFAAAELAPLKKSLDTQLRPPRRNDRAGKLPPPLPTAYHCVLILRAINWRPATPILWASFYGRVTVLS